MILPLAASATRDSIQKKGPGSTYIAPSLQEFANTHGDKEKVDVIIQSSGGVSGAHGLLKAAAAAVGDAGPAGPSKGKGGKHDEKSLDLVGGVSAQLTVKTLKKLVTSDGLVITPDAPAHATGEASSKQLWPYESGNAANWREDGNLRGQTPSIAVVDSGIADRSGFGDRVVASVDLTTLPNNSAGDGRGHGTFVAGIAADAAREHAGAAPSANLVSIDVMDDSGTGSTSDIIAACQWILDHKDQYNIRVANFSLHSSIVAPFYYDPLDRAVEKLWFNGITVVTAAGNYGTAGAPSGVRYSPGNDPFVITVGAADLNGTVRTNDDTMAPWSSWGHTMDGFSKPELAAPGRFMVGPVSAGASLLTERPDHIVAPGYMQLSGTSFSAPVVSGTAWQIIARHPNWTPDQVKGALMLTSRPLGHLVGLAGGVGEITASKAVGVNNPPNPNKALNKYLVPGTNGGVAFDSASWVDAAKTNASWDSASWDSASWDSASWDSASWDSASWESASWLDASWLDASWLDASWLDASWEDAADGDAVATGYDLSPEDVIDLTGDLAPDPASLPAGLVTPPAAPAPVPAPTAAPAPTVTTVDPAPAPAPTTTAADPVTTTVTTTTTNATTVATVGGTL